MTDDPFEKLLREAADRYNAPPEPPREAMWARIQAARRGSTPGDAPGHAPGHAPGPSASPGLTHAPGQARGPDRETRASRAWWKPTLGLAAALVLGLALGRLTHEPVRIDADEPIAGVGGEAAGLGGAETPLAYRLVATRHFTETEAMLTAYRQMREGGAGDTEITDWARDLLTDTRLLLDSPVAADVQLRPLLDDLELLLIQIAHIADRPGSDAESGLIDDAFEQRDILHRLRAVVPAGPVSGT